VVLVRFLDLAETGARAAFVHVAPSLADVAAAWAREPFWRWKREGRARPRGQESHAEAWDVTFLPVGGAQAKPRRLIWLQGRSHPSLAPGQPDPDEPLTAAPWSGALSNSWSCQATVLTRARVLT
jgi:hypothetical protein